MPKTSPEEWPKEFRETYISMLNSEPTGTDGLLIVSKEFYEKTCDLMGITMFWQKVNRHEVVIDPDAKIPWRFAELMDLEKIIQLIQKNGN